MAVDGMGNRRLIEQVTGVDANDTVVRSLYATAREQLSEPNAIVTLSLSDEAGMLAFGTGRQPEQVASLPIGLRALADQLFGSGTITELAIEQGIEKVEERVMPWQRKLPTPARLFTGGDDIVDIACMAGMPRDGDTWMLSTDSVEQLFNRWIARVQGRPASQDDLPLTPRFSASLLVLRECLHHLGFDSIIVLRELPDTSAGVTSAL